MNSMRNSMVGVVGMGWLSQRASRRLLAFLAVFGVGGIAGLLAGFSADAVQTSELSPAEIVALRFPGDSGRMAANPIAAVPVHRAIDPSPAPAGYVLASAGSEDASSLMFNPFPTYSSAPHPSPASSSAPSSALNSTSPRPSPSRSALPPQLVTASLSIPAEALAYAAPDAEEPATPVARPESASAAPAKRAIQPPRPASPASSSNAVLNNAQIASIRERLKLTSYQDQLWPPVESALRDISWHQGHADAGGRKVVSNTTNGHEATIDPNSVPVQRLKSAAFPLIMSLSNDQKQEVRTMVRLMGLENLASQF
jgi:hypothetical protein